MPMVVQEAAEADSAQVDSAQVLIMERPQPSASRLAALKP